MKYPRISSCLFGVFTFAGFMNNWKKKSASSSSRLDSTSLNTAHLKKYGAPGGRPEAKQPPVHSGSLANDAASVFTSNRAGFRL